MRQHIIVSFSLFLLIWIPSKVCFGQTNSVLATGIWYKIGITQSGIYKLALSDLQKAGISTSIDPRNLHIYGNGGGMLPQANVVSRPTDLTEIAIQVEGENDGQLDNTDYILFYGQGTHIIYHDSLTSRLSHKINIYSDTAYYFLTVNNIPGKRITTSPSVTGATQQVTTFDDYIFHEIEMYNILGSGRSWWGEKFDAVTTQSFTFDIPGIISSKSARLEIAVMAQSTASSQFSIKSSEQSIGTLSMSPISSGTYDIKGTTNSGNFTFSPSGSPLPITLTFERSTGVGYLDRIGIQSSRQLKLYGTQTTFRTFESFTNEKLRYHITEAGNTARIWDISTIHQPSNIKYSTQGSELVFEAVGRQWKEFVVFNPQAILLTPESIRQVANQNIRASTTPELLIITHPDFYSEAQRLAAFRTSHDGLTTLLITPSQIYNEFSSGKQDISAIRDFIRSLYQQSINLKYVLLFGDASYDYKNRLTGNTNYIPVYESIQSLHPIYSYSSDDFFGFMEENEGEWIENGSGDHTLEVSIGRLPVKTRQEASIVVDKLIGYTQNPEALGNWRQKISFVADDGDANTHQLDANRLATLIESTYPTYASKKIFLDAYPQISYSNGQQSPEAVAAIDQAVDNGCLIMNYTGHGSEIGWAQEQILSIGQIQGWNNRNHLPLFVTATCEFGRYDNPERVSGAELVLLNAAGGGIGLLTTTRPVFSSSNYAINLAFYNSVFAPVNGAMPRLGDIMRYTKNNSLSGSVNRNFALLGDPSMRLAYPSLKTVLTKVNSKPFISGKDTLKALAHVTLEGEIEDESGTSMTNFNGTLQTTLFDKSTTHTTLGTESTRMSFSEQDNALFRGQSTIKNGQFQISFVVPKDINYQVGTGILSMYAKPAEGTQDAAGVQQLLVGGSHTDPIADNTPPQIKLFLNDTTFISGGTTTPNSIFLAKLNDENGITISQTGIGHELLAILDDSVVITMNDYFTSLTDTYQKGEIRYSFENLTPGKHTITLRAWDTYNNSSEATLDFTVVSDAFHIWNLHNYPNPATESTYFAFEHNRSGNDLEVVISVYSSTGQLIRTLQKNISSATAKVDNIEWNLTSGSENKLVGGVYFYQVRVRCIADSTILAQKMIIVR
ncbi:type IX secretion system sortase PorU [Cytophagaceae bacterium DM2B3-1]|uniref:Type IX secretion system sortase PorU n=1 Tax=Xanthocytophaga flava TaxID=3048013 RepID=A0ABT7CYH5_9BACT|nr:type IX secretion system sortase PorU [Xanthocytophaga flavus]MDJ1498829.1 type IX secretion system sortase PorU [Xanthocytophaga flavus]